MEVYSGTSSDDVGRTIAKWFSEKQKLPVTAPYAAMAWTMNGNPVAAAIFNGYTGSAIEFHYYSDKLITRQIIRDIIRYVFVQHKCNILIAKIPRLHKKLRGILPRMGFKYLTIIPMYYGVDKSQDAIMYYSNLKLLDRWVK